MGLRKEKTRPHFPALLRTESLHVKIYPLHIFWGEITMKFPPQVTEKINTILDSAYADGRTCLYEHEVYGILQSIGLKVPGFFLADNPDRVDENVMKKFSQAIVIKVVSPQIAHKQKLGGVKIIRNLDPLFVQFVISKMRDEVLSHFPEAEKPDIKGFLLTEFIPHTSEDC